MADLTYMIVKVFKNDKWNFYFLCLHDISLKECKRKFWFNGLSSMFTDNHNELSLVREKRKQEKDGFKNTGVTFATVSCQINLCVISIQMVCDLKTLNDLTKGASIESGKMRESVTERFGMDSGQSSKTGLG